MTVEELRKRRDELQGELAAAVAPLLAEFQHETGAEVESIDLELIDVSTVGGPRWRVLGGVQVRIAL